MDRANATSAGETAQRVTFRDAFRVWLKIGVLSFGGPAGQIALMHRILVDEKKWIGEARFLHALNYCMVLPGPEATQLATYIGWMLHRTAGGLAAGLLFVLPGTLVILALSTIYAGFQKVPLVEALFFGIKAAVLAVVVEALFRIAKRALKNSWMYALAAAAFVGIFFLDIPFPLIVIGAGLVGYVGGRWRPQRFIVVKPHGAAAAETPRAAEVAHDARPPVRPSSTVATALLWLAIWLAPVALLWAALGWSNPFTEIGKFFSAMAVVTFGGAYAVLAYVAQEAVSTYHWLSAGEMLDGLGLAETTPGPLILVLQYVGYLAGFRQSLGLNPYLAGTLGAALTVWVTFVPSFLMIFVGAPYVERTRGMQGFSAALSGITAAVVGVVLNLTVWFALHVLFAKIDTLRWHGLRLYVPELASIDWVSLALAAASIVAMLRFKIGMLTTLAAAAALGAAYHLALR
ncbi:MAG TPA: chromate efflux transporter [Alphaproteobacteria bacterium]|jgi:chromate transporter